MTATDAALTIVEMAIAIPIGVFIWIRYHEVFEDVIPRVMAWIANGIGSPIVRAAMWMHRAARRGR